MKLKDLTPTQRRDIGAGAGISVDFLRHMAKGRRTVSALLAQRIERAAGALGLRLRREDMCAACRKCDLAKQARKAAAEDVK